MEPKRVAVYARVSTDEQTVENQLLQLNQYAMSKGWVVTHTITDEGISGSKGRDDRPGFKKLHDSIANKEFDIILAWTVDRLGRSVQHLANFLETMHNNDVDLCLVQQGLDTTTPTGKMIFQILSVIAEFERSLIRERTKAGLARVKANGVRLGQKPLDDLIVQKVLQARQKQKSYREIAEELGISHGTVGNVLKREGLN